MKSAAKTAQNQSKFMRFITTPFRVLGKARDFYVQSLTNCAGRVSYGGAVGTMPRSFSTASSARSNTDYDNEDFRELVRAASMKSLGNDRIDLEMLLRQQQVARQSTAAAAAAVKRSVSVGMGRIDEDTPCDDFGGVGGGGGNQSSVSDKVKNNLFYPRSKSYAVTKKSLVF